MAEGSIKWYDEKKGFGFIDRGPDEDDIWFHSRDRGTGIDEAQFVPGARVSFEVSSSARGPKACITRVLVSGAEPALAEPEAPQYTLDDALAGLQEALLGASEWLDIVRALVKAGRA